MSAKKQILFGVTALAVFIAGVGYGRKSVRDDNAGPVYGSLGLPVNCRAYVQTAIDGYRSQKYTALESMNGLERNCGVLGQSWKNMRD